MFWRSKQIALVLIGSSAALAGFSSLAIHHDNNYSTTQPTGSGYYGGSGYYYHSGHYYGGSSYSGSSHGSSTSHGGFGSTGHAAHS